MYRALPRYTEPQPFIPLLLPLSKTVKRARKQIKELFPKKKIISLTEIYTEKADK
jgi:hypothetical protein